MLAILALVCFVLSFFGVDVDNHSLLALGLAFLAAHHLVGDRVDVFRRR